MINIYGEPWRKPHYIQHHYAEQNANDSIESIGHATVCSKVSRTRDQSDQSQRKKTRNPRKIEAFHPCRSVNFVKIELVEIYRYGI